MPETWLRFNCCYWATGRGVLNISSTVDTCSPEQPFWSKKNEWLSYVSALIIMLSFSDTERILERPSHIWLLCHKNVKETSQPDHSHSGCHTPNTRDLECWDQSPFTSRAAPVIQWIPVWPPSHPLTHSHQAPSLLHSQHSNTKPAQLVPQSWYLHEGAQRTHKLLSLLS